MLGSPFTFFLIDLLTHSKVHSFLKKNNNNNKVKVYLSTTQAVQGWYGQLHKTFRNPGSF